MENCLFSNFNTIFRVIRTIIILTASGINQRWKDGKNNNTQKDSACLVPLLCPEQAG
jgi:hypothetical protein